MAATRNKGALGECVGCGVELPLRLPRAGDSAHGWMCLNCRTVYHSVLIAKAPLEQRRNVRPAKYHFDEYDLPTAPKMLEPYVRHLNEQEEQDDRRQSPRKPLVVPAAVMPLDDFMHPAGEAFWAVTKDVSAGGLCLFARQCVTTPYLAVQLERGEEMSDLQFIIKIVRRQSVGMGFQLAGPIAAKLGDTYLPIENETDSAAQPVNL